MQTTLTMLDPMNSAGTVTPSARRRWPWVLIVFGLVAAIAAGTWLALNQGKQQSAASNSGRWVSSTGHNQSTVVSATGTVRLKTGAQVRVGAQLSGIVRRLNVTVGSKIRQGEVIAELDSSSVIAKIEQAKSQLAQSQVALQKAQTDFARSAKLYEAGIIPAQQFEDARATVAAAKASVAAAESAEATARVDLSYVQIRAPISGTIASVSTQQGETVAASFATPTFVTIIQEGALEVIAMVDEADIGNVHRGESVAFTAETYPDHEFSGTVTRIAPIATIVSGVVNYEVAVSISRDIALLRPDMTTNVNIHTSQHQALVVPAKSIHKEGGQSFVYVKSSAGNPERRNVAVGPRTGSDIEITAGLKPGEAVFVEEDRGQS